MRAVDPWHDERMTAPQPDPPTPFTAAQASALREQLLEADYTVDRVAERIGNRVLGVIGPIMLGPVRKYRAVHTKTVAKAMLVCAERAAPGIHIVESDVIQELGAG